jgi:cephalosporin hydroxylase
MGIQTQKCPHDLWTYQEILFETRPETILEMGTLHGGSALYLASVCDVLELGEIVTVDLLPVREALPRHPRITYLGGRSSTDVELVRELTARVRGRRTMVILDSDHSQDHVLAELRAYAGLVSPGCYLVVEDTNLNGHPVFKKHGPGPREAVTEFLRESSDFEIDRRRERLLLTFNPGGYLRRAA